MSILERLRQLIASNINALLDSISDPGSAIDELISNMEAASRDARARVKEALTADKLAARLQESTRRGIEEWKARAERAVTAHDDGLAKEALSRVAELEEERRTIDEDRSKSKAEISELERGLRDLDAKIRVVKARKETLKAVVRARAVGGGAVDRYEKIVHGVDAAEAENELDAELNATQKSQDVSDRIDKLTNEKDANDRLAELKAKMKQS